MAWFHFHRHLHNAFIPHPGNDYRPHAIRHHWLGRYAIALLLVKVAAIGWATLSTAPARVSDVTPANIINLSNQARKNNGFSTLATNSLLNQAAKAKANDMLREQYFAHVSPSNISPWHWFNQAGYAYQHAGENLAIDYLEAEDVISAWLASASHRTNLLSTKYKDIGVAVVSGNFQGAQSILVVQMFGAPKPAPTTTVASTPAQSPPPAQVQLQLAQGSPPAPSAPPPAPPVVAPTPPPVPKPPDIPTLITPAADTFVRTGRPEVIGKAEAGSQVELLVDETVVGSAAAADGVYTVIPDRDLTDGLHQLQVRAVARGLTSETSAQRAIRVDTTAPEVLESGTFALFSILGQDTYDIFVATDDDATAVQCACGGTVTPLRRFEQRFQGQVRVGDRQSTSTVLALTVSDEAGNTAELGLVDTELFTAGVAAASSGPVVSALNALALSRTFLVVFLAIMLLLALVNVVVVWERQHHPTIVGTLMVIYLAGSLLLL